MAKRIKLALLMVLAGCLAACGNMPAQKLAPTLTYALAPSATLARPATPTGTAAPTRAPTATTSPIPSATSTPAPTPTPALTLFEKFKLFPWVDYAPTHYNPPGEIPTEEQITDDLKVLYAAGFRGIVTYGSGGVLAEVPRLAREAGFQGVVMGIWAPDDASETEAAVRALPYVDGYVAGNEGISFDRYDYATLEQAVTALRKATSKPVTTTEVFTQYFKNPKLLTLGDWVFPNAHPYWQQITDPLQASKWTQSTFEALVQKAGSTPVILKEVGLPSAGAPKLSEYQQAEYYVRLRESGVAFVYFEAFDQFWKTEDKVGPHWGLFAADRSAKVASQYILRGYPPFYIYADAKAPYNHFVPEGFMGCTSGIKVSQNDATHPYSGTTSIKITYTPCPPSWAGIYWWDPPGSNWCAKPGGFDLTGWTKLTFWARGEKGDEPVEFKVGGLQKANGDACDTMTVAKTTYPLTLTTEWTQYTIPLFGEPLDHLAGGFVWVTDSDKPITIYLDEIRFEWSGQ